MSENKIITAVTKVVDLDYEISSNDIICIDASTNRIGIGTIDPSESIHISGGAILVQNSDAHIKINSEKIVQTNGNYSGIIDFSSSISGIILQYNNGPSGNVIVSKDYTEIDTLHTNNIYSISPAPSINVSGNMIVHGTISAEQFIGDVSANDISTNNLFVRESIIAHKFIGDVSANDISVNNLFVHEIYSISPSQPITVSGNIIVYGTISAEQFIGDVSANDISVNNLFVYDDITFNNNIIINSNNSNFISIGSNIHLKSNNAELNLTDTSFMVKTIGNLGAKTGKILAYNTPYITQTNVDISGNIISNLDLPKKFRDAANKEYVDQYMHGLIYSEHVQFINTGSPILDTSFTDTIGLIIDGSDVSIPVNNMPVNIILNTQLNNLSNGIYTVSSNNTLIRRDGYTQDICAGTYFLVEYGQKHAGSGWVLKPTPSNNKTIKIGDDSLNFVQVGAPGNITYSGGPNINVSPGGLISLKDDISINDTITTNRLHVDNLATFDGDICYNPALGISYPSLTIMDAHVKKNFNDIAANHTAISTNTANITKISNSTTPFTGSTHFLDQMSAPTIFCRNIKNFTSGSAMIQLMGSPIKVEGDYMLIATAQGLTIEDTPETGTSNLILTSSTITANSILTITANSTLTLTAGGDKGIYIMGIKSSQSAAQNQYSLTKNNVKWGDVNTTVWPVGVFLNPITSIGVLDTDMVTKIWSPLMYATGAAGNQGQIVYHYSNSDKKLKTNIEPFRRKLDIINKLNPVYFNWIKSGNSDYGFIAQEIEVLIPGIIRNNTDSSGEITKVYDYEASLHLIPVLTKAIQDLDADKNREIAELKAENDELKIRISTLESQMAYVLTLLDTSNI